MDRTGAAAETKATPKPAPPKRADVDVTPITVEEYKEKYGEKGEKQDMGRLGPDLDDESLLMKKAVQEKVKQFSKELHRINRQRQEQVKPKPQAKPEPKPNARAKALEFAQNVPKPKPVPKPQLVVDKGGHLTGAAARASAVVTEERDDLEEIRRREKQHFEDVAKVAQIREFLSSLAV
mmetsp:Transcript_898/g.2491  ORF Transcript_898/g.2491 Transcript_898/m.2491 type:complete len:179 (-) Transcript_898:262-798(-)